MKNIFGVNLTDDRSNEEIDGAVFIKKKITETQRNALNGISGAAAAQGEKESIAQPLRLLKIFSCLCFLVIFVVVLRMMSKLTLAEVYQQIPYAFFCGGILLVICVILQLAEQRKKKENGKENSAENLKNNYEAVLDISKQQLNIPGNALEMDILMFFYRVKNGEDLLITTGGMKVFRNAAEYVFTDNGNLCVADVFQCLEIPLEAIREIRKVEEKLIVAGWNKNIPFNYGIYKQYNLIRNQYGFVTMKTHYRAVVDHDGISYEMLIPVYEIDSFLKLTGKEITA